MQKKADRRRGRERESERKRRRERAGRFTWRETRTKSAASLRRGNVGGRNKKVYGCFGCSIFRTHISWHAVPTPFLSVSLFLSLLLPFLSFRPLVCSRFSQLNPRLNYFAAKIVECAFQLKGAARHRTRGFTRSERNAARCQNKSGRTRPVLKVFTCKRKRGNLTRSVHRVIIARTCKDANTICDLSEELPSAR